VIVAVDEAAERISAGGVVGVPTDTVYGLACDPRAPAAVERVYAIKQRPAELELSLLGASLDDLAACGALDGRARALAEAFWPGALSIIVPARPDAGLAVPRRGDTVSVRIPAHDVLLELLARTGPLATTSANRHGEPAARTAAECEAAVGADVDGILDGKPGAGLGSTIIDLTEAPPRMVRLGPIRAEALRPYLG
jgi:tRNA threonylcarbamoyl adenosine modification protein (Sua5/YciO/YrdC/YwlC family)